MDSRDEARAAVAAGQFERAYQLYTDWLSANPNDAQALREYGKALYCRYQDLDTANELFERAIALEPNSVETLLWLGDLAALGYGRGYAAALEHYRRALELDPNAVDAYIGIGMLHRAPGAPVSLDDAIGAFRSAAQRAPGRSDVHQNLGMALIQAGDTTAARAALTQVERLLSAAGKQRQAGAMQSVLGKLERGERIASFSYANESPRYACT